MSPHSSKIVNQGLIDFYHRLIFIFDCFPRHILSLKRKVQELLANKDNGTITSICAKQLKSRRISTFLCNHCFRESSPNSTRSFTTLEVGRMCRLDKQKCRSGANPVVQGSIIIFSSLIFLRKPRYGFNFFLCILSCETQVFGLFGASWGLPC